MLLKQAYGHSDHFNAERHTSYSFHSLRILPALTIPVCHDRDIHPQTVHKFHNSLEPLYERSFSGPHVSSSTVHSKRTYTRPDDPFNQSLGIILRREKPNLGRHRDLGGKLPAKRRENITQEVRIRQERSAHAGVRAERLGTAAVQIDARHVLNDRLGCLYGEFWGC